MNINDHNSQRDRDKSEIRFLRITCGILGVVLVLSGSLSFKLAGSGRDTVIPPEVHKTFWVNDETFSPEYLEEMTYFIAGLQLNVTPANIDYQLRQFQKYAAPNAFGRLEVAGKLAAEKIRRESASTLVSAQQIIPDVSNRKGAICGMLSTYVTDKLAGTRQSCWVVDFDYLNGRIHVKDFRETSMQDPFGAAKAGIL